VCEVESDHRGGQVASFAETVQSDPNLAGGFNLLGYSQGGIVTRAFLEMHNKPPVHNYVTLGAPHVRISGISMMQDEEVADVCVVQAGEGGVPQVHIPGLDPIADEVLYEDWAQRTFSFAGYWHDPLDEQRYLDKCKFLPYNSSPKKSCTEKSRAIDRPRPLSCTHRLWHISSHRHKNHTSARARKQATRSYMYFPRRP
jgi:pimeloyl-ACP methyl ester carboxylesterase